MSRYEDWTKDDNGMVTTVVVEVRDGDVVHVADELLPEFELDPAKGVATTNTFRERFVYEFPYDVVAGQLRATGWSKADNPTPEPLVEHFYD